MGGASENKFLISAEVSTNRYLETVSSSVHVLQVASPPDVVCRRSGCRLDAIASQLKRCGTQRGGPRPPPDLWPLESCETPAELWAVNKKAICSDSDRRFGSCLSFSRPSWVDPGIRQNFCQLLGSISRPNQHRVMGYDHDHMSDYGLFIICTPWQFWLKIFGSDAELLFRILKHGCYR